MTKDLSKIASKMVEDGVSSEFAFEITKYAVLYEGAYDLMMRYDQAEDPFHKEMIIMAFKVFDSYAKDNNEG